MTSKDEVDRLVFKLNSSISSNRSEECFVFDRSNPVSVKISYQDTHPKTVAVSCSEGKVEEESNSQRFTSTALLKILKEDGHSLPIEGKSKPCLTSLQALIMAAHHLLLEISNSEYFSDEIRRECKNRYRIAYLRGKELAVGDSYPFPEDIYFEFKGGKDDNQDTPSPWSERAFENSFKTHAVQSIAAFINTKIRLRKIPLSPCRVVFGVLDHGRKIQGIEYNGDRAKLSDKLVQRIREQFENKMVRINKTTASYATQIGNAVYVHIDEVTPPRNTSTDGEVKKLILVTVALVFDKELFNFTIPCLLLCAPRIDDRLIAHCYYRRSGPDKVVKTVTAANQSDVLDELFPYGYQQLEIQEDSTNAEKVAGGREEEEEITKAEVVEEVMKVGKEGREFTDEEHN
jgi:hypothetical protein